MALKAPRHERRRLAKERFLNALVDEMARWGIMHLFEDFALKSSDGDMKRVLYDYLTRDEALAVVRLNEWYRSAELPRNAHRAPFPPDIPSGTAEAILGIMEGGTEEESEVCSYLLFVIAHAEAIRRVRS